MSNIMTETELAYIAGFVDGEGCISVYRRSNGITYVPSLSISNTNLEVLQYINGLLGGVGYFIEMKSHNPKWKTAWKLRFDSKKCGEVLKPLLPYVRVKHQQMEMALILIDFQSGKNGQQVLESAASAKKTLYDAIKKLNTRGNV